jgi:hypothetical protein
VAATTSLSEFPPEEIFAYSYPFTVYSWCGEAGADLPNVTINMTEHVVLHGLLSGGYRNSAGNMQYVTAFSLDYTETDDSDRVLHQLQSDAVVHVPAPGSLSLLLLPQPIVAKTLHFHVHDYVGLGACWTLALFGCTLTEASSAVVTVISVAVIVAVGVALCWGITTGHIFASRKSTEQRGRLHTLRAVENELYTDPAPDTSYEGTFSESQPHYAGSVLYALPTTSSATTNDNATGQLQGYETVQPGSGEGGRGSLVGNPAYLTSPEVNLEQQLSKAGYEAMAPAPHSTNQQQEYSYVMI